MNLCFHLLTSPSFTSPPQSLSHNTTLTILLTVHSQPSASTSVPNSPSFLSLPLHTSSQASHSMMTRQKINTRNTKKSLITMST
jgi:hypothetical protein